MPKTQTYLILSSLWRELKSILCAPLPQPAGCEALCAARAQYVDHPADFCFRLPDGLSHEQGAFAEPLSVGAQSGCTAGAAHPSCAGRRASVLLASYSLTVQGPTTLFMQRTVNECHGTKIRKTVRHVSLALVPVCLQVSTPAAGAMLRRGKPLRSLARGQLVRSALFILVFVLVHRLEVDCALAAQDLVHILSGTARLHEFTTRSLQKQH